MSNDFFVGLFMFGAYLTVDFLIFKYFIHNKKGLIQIVIAKMKAKKQY